MAREKREEHVASEFLVFDIGAGAKVGGSYSLLGTADSMAKAEELVRSLPSASATKVAIVERKAVLVRRPTIELLAIDERIVADKS